MRSDWNYKRSLVITETDSCDISESFCNGGKAKIPRRVVCKVSTGLYCACASADIVLIYQYKTVFALPMTIREKQVLYFSKVILITFSSKVKVKTI